VRQQKIKNKGYGKFKRSTGSYVTSRR